MYVRETKAVSRQLGLIKGKSVVDLCVAVPCMALVIALLSVLVIVEGSTTTQWQNKQVYHHSMNTSGNDTLTLYRP